MRINVDRSASVTCTYALCKCMLFLNATAHWILGVHIDLHWSGSALSCGQHQCRASPSTSLHTLDIVIFYDTLVHTYNPEKTNKQTNKNKNIQTLLGKIGPLLLRAILRNADVFSLSPSDVTSTSTISTLSIFSFTDPTSNLAFFRVNSPSVTDRKVSATTRPPF